MKRRQFIRHSFVVPASIGGLSGLHLGLVDCMGQLGNATDPPCKVSETITFSGGQAGFPSRQAAGDAMSQDTPVQISSNVVTQPSSLCAKLNPPGMSPAGFKVRGEVKESPFTPGSWYYEFSGTVNMTYCGGAV